MNHVSKYAFLMSFTCLTAIPVMAENVTTGDQLLEKISSNVAGNSLLLEIDNDLALSDNIGNVNGNITIDGGIAKNKIDGNKHTGFSVEKGNKLTVQNAKMENFAGDGTLGLMLNVASEAEATISNVDFSNNEMLSKAEGTGALSKTGSLIKNFGVLNLQGNFSDNLIHNEANEAIFGGILYTAGTVNNVSGVFKNNTIKSNTNIVSGTVSGAIIYIPNMGKIEKIDGEFYDNTAYSYNGSAQGGVVTNYKGEITSIDGKFSNNKAHSYSSRAEGGAIYNKYTLNKMSGEFIGNKAFSESGKGDASGGVLYNTGTINLISDAIFKNNENYGKSGFGGVIYNALYNVYITKIENSVFEGNSTMAILPGSMGLGGKALGGAIYNDANAKIDEIVNSSFKNNSAITQYTNGVANGGAIYSENNLTIKANNGKTSEFSGNYVQDALGNRRNNAIYIGKSGKTLSLDASSEGVISFDDTIEGASSYNIVITGDDTGTVAFNNEIKNAGNITSSNVNLVLGSSEEASANMAGANLKITSGTLDMANDKIQSVEMKKFTSTENVKLKIDADLSKGESDKIIADSVEAGSKIAIEKINILADGNKDIIVFAGEKSPEFTNLDSFAAFTSFYKYTFKSETAGVLSTDIIKATQGLNAAVGDSSLTRSYTVSEGQNTHADLGMLEGGENITMSILGNNNALSGVSADGNQNYAGLITSETHTVSVENVTSVEGFASEDGGFIKNSGELNVNNSSFKNNSAVGDGGAIWSDGNVNLTADGGNVEFSGNTANNVSNAIYMADAAAALNLNAKDGSITFNDAIDGVEGYNININGTDNGTVNFNQVVSNAANININGSNVVLANDSHLNGSSIALNSGTMHLDNQSIGDEIRFRNMTGSNGVLHIDVNTVEKTADKIGLENLYGEVKVIAHNINNENSRVFVANSEQEGIKFAEVSNDNSGKFNVLRVENSVYAWNALSKANSNGGADWLMEVKKDGNNEKPVVVAEAAAYLGLNSASFEQTRDMVRNVENKVAASAVYSKNCNGYYDASYNGKPLYNLWVSPVYNSAKVDAPVNFKADISGLEAGGDIVSDVYNRLGFFVSYRQGEYDLNGNNDFYTINTGSDINIDSYMSGLYYRYTNRNLWAMATIFAGVQKADIKTDDGIKTNSDASEFGLAINSGYSIVLPDNMVAEPQLGLSYTNIDWDNISDNYGKTAKLKAFSQVEIEAGVKFEKTLSLDDKMTKVYVKPSIVQSLSSGDKVYVSGLNPVNTLDDQTLGRVMGGVSCQITEEFNVFANAGYTFGSDYENVSANIGINYAF